MDWLLNNTIYLAVHGSQCYGMATENSDLDAKGICIPPSEIENDLFHTFEQAENNIDIEKQISHLRNPKNPKIETTVYSLKKFIKLAAAVNPNVLELLYVKPEFQIIKNSAAEKLIQNRDLFLSARANFTFAGYAYAQLNKIQRHRKWIITPRDLKQPRRNEYGLPEEAQQEVEEVFRYVKGEVEKWNLSGFPLDENEKGKLKETIWELVYEISSKKVNWENWVVAYTVTAIEKLARTLNLKEELLDLIKRENQYRRDLQTYNSWINWKNNRNPARKALEEKSQYDTKHASQLIRLLRSGLEILETGKFNVFRDDAEELLLIKNGGWTYDSVVEYAEMMNKKMAAAYKITKLPKSVNYVAINSLYQELLFLGKTRT